MTHPPNTSPVLLWWRRGLITITAVSAALASFTFLRDLAIAAGWPPTTALLLPLSIDALAGMALAEYRLTGNRTAATTAVLVIVGSAVGNALSHMFSTDLWVPAPGVVIAVGAVPAIALGLVVHLATKGTSTWTAQPDTVVGHRTGTSGDNSPPVSSSVTDVPGPATPPGHASDANAVPPVVTRGTTTIPPASKAGTASTTRSRTTRATSTTKRSDTADERNERIHGSKLTKEQAREPKVNAPVTFIVIDEVQRAFTSEHGDRIAAALVDLAKNAPSSGLVLILATQRSGADEFPSELRAVAGARFALHVVTWRDSDMILGDQMAADGYDAHNLPLHKGVGILRPDDDADDVSAGDDDARPAKTIRIYDTSDTMWHHICALGADLRRKLAQEAPSDTEDGDDERDELLPAAQLLARIQTHAPGALPDHVTDPRTMGEWLSGLGVPTEPRKIAGQRVRSRVSVEGALGVSRGCLKRAQTDSPDTLWHLLGTPTTTRERRARPCSRAGSCTCSLRCRW